jgi:hypothetical protein
MAVAGRPLLWSSASCQHWRNNRGTAGVSGSIPGVIYTLFDNAADAAIAYAKSATKYFGNFAVLKFLKQKLGHEARIKPETDMTKIEREWRHKSAQRFVDNFNRANPHRKPHVLISVRKVLYRGRECYKIIHHNEPDLIRLVGRKPYFAVISQERMQKLADEK